MSDTDDPPMSDDEIDACAARLESLPLDDAVWVARLIAECRRARQAAMTAHADHPAQQALQAMEQDIAQIVLDAAEWLQTLWNVGYMGAGHFPAAPKSAFPNVGIEDILQSALLARIRRGRRPLPFPPPTRQGVPWHDVVESDECFIVEAALVRDEDDPSRVVGAVIESCLDWQVRETRVPDVEYLVQHQGKGPLYRLLLDPFCSRLERVPPTVVRRIVVRDRAGIRSFALEWPAEGGATRAVPLRALSEERAESEALHWLATCHPELYGQVRFDVAAAAA